MRTWQEFAAQWHEDILSVRPVFEALARDLAARPDVTLALVERPGVSFSLRATRAGQSLRPLFALVDVVDEDPARRWLSVCFYADCVTDPNEMGELIPLGLLGEDGHCFNLEGPDDAILAAALEAVSEAYDKAS